MTEPTDAATKETYEAAIRSFTEAEIALREIVAALQRYRSASDTVVEAGGTLNASRDALLATLDTLETTAAEMVRVSSGLGQATAVIAAIDQERFWASFAQLESATSSSSDALAQSVASSTERLADDLRGRIDTAVVDLAVTNKASTGEISSAISAVRRISTQARAAAVASVVIGIAAIVMVAAQLLR